MPGTFCLCELTNMPNIETILRDHVTLQIECIDRLYLNGYQPRLQHEGGLVGLLLRDPNNHVPSPALLGQMTASSRSSKSGCAVSLIP